MAMNWTQLTEAIESFSEQDASQPGTELFIAQLPTFINNAELRIYRDLDFLATRGTNYSLKSTPGNRSVVLVGVAANDYPVYPVVVQGFGVVTPANTAPTAGSIVQFEQTSLDFIDTYWPSESTTAKPSYGSCYFAMYDHQTIVAAPTFDAAYVLQVTGTWRPKPMSATNPETYLGDQFQDLLLAGSMIEASAWMRDFGGMSDDPKMALSWESHYGSILRSAMEEEARKKGQGPGWQPFSPTPEAKPRA